MIQRLARRVIPRPLRNWLRAPAQSLHWLSDELQYRVGLTRTVTVDGAGVLSCHPAAARTAYAPALRDAAQRDELASVLGTATDDALFFDIGAHFGLFALAFARRAGPTARVVALDPSPTACAMLQRQRRLNDLAAPRVTVECAAAGAEPGWMEFVAVGVQAAGYFVPPDAGHPSRERLRVPVTTVDSLAERFGRPTHLKIDVEGAEGDVLRGAQHTLDVARPLVFLELHGDLIRRAGGDAEAPCRMLSRHRYVIFATDGRQMRLEDIVREPLIRVVARPA